MTQDGLFSTLLGSNNLIDPQIFSQHPETYLGVSVDGESEITPRSKLAFAPYALYAVNAGTAPAVFHNGGGGEVSAQMANVFPPFRNGDPITLEWGNSVVTQHHNHEGGSQTVNLPGDPTYYSVMNGSAIGELGIRDGAITGDKLAIDSVSTAAIRNGAVSQDKLGIGAVGTAELTTAAVSQDKIALGTVPLRSQTGQSLRIN